MSGQSVEDRAADVIHDAIDGEGWNAMTIAAALAAQSLLVGDDTERLVALGRAVEAIRATAPQARIEMGLGTTIGAIYEAAGVTP